MIEQIVFICHAAVCRSVAALPRLTHRNIVTACHVSSNAPATTQNHVIAAREGPTNAVPCCSGALVAVGV
jgi:hypothetical protein